MRAKLAVLFLASIFVFLSLSSAYAAVDVNLFFGDLAPYGTWVSTPAYGEVWFPAHRGPHWRPYLVGRWISTDEGWTWISDEPWGWATYHYGRWVVDPVYGWVWIPGAVWAPAWVAWYTGPNFIGWVPLQPVASIRLSPNFAVFVPWNAFFSPNLAVVAVPVAGNVTIIPQETFINNITIVNNVVTLPGPSITLVQNNTGRTVEQIHIISRNLNITQVKNLGRNVDVFHGRTFESFRPGIIPEKKHHVPFLKNESERGIIQAGNRRLSMGGQHPFASKMKSFLHLGKKQAPSKKAEPEKVRARPNASQPQHIAKRGEPEKVRARPNASQPQHIAKLNAHEKVRAKPNLPPESSGNKPLPQFHTPSAPHGGEQPNQPPKQKGGGQPQGGGKPEKHHD